MGEHVFTEKEGRGIQYEDFECIDEARACLIMMGSDFDYCPFCGEEL